MFQQTSVTYTWLLYMLRLLHFMTVLNDVTLIIQRDSIQSPVYFSGNCKGMLNSICLPGTEFGFKFPVLRVLGCHIYVDWLFMSFDCMKKCLLSHFCSLISVTWLLVFRKILRISFRVAFLSVHHPKFWSASVSFILIFLASHFDLIGTW